MTETNTPLSMNQSPRRPTRYVSPKRHSSGWCEGRFRFVRARQSKFPGESQRYKRVFTSSHFRYTRTGEEERTCGPILPILGSDSPPNKENCIPRFFSECG
ncbi:hypothetical protein E2C01_088501 [Portunus trituberculatus]|uniref:Uncharacterized protein n=1 Tax=Portunus trituberculatus TaxID=210409 RepID=A0A5B7JFL1_PORTR|nr:hypothetical protein [Portunus trituberculatus]